MKQDEALKILTTMADMADAVPGRVVTYRFDKAAAIEALRVGADALSSPQPETVSPTTHICPVCSTPLESRGGYIRVIIGKPDVASGIQGASWYCAECDRVWDYGDLPSNTRQLADMDACDRLRWLLTQAERVARVEDADRAAVDRACRLMQECDNGFDRERW